MTERNKVIEALEACVLKDPDDSRDCKHCPRCNYGAFITNSCINGVMADALALLKAQEPITGETSDGYHTFNELYHHRAVLFSVIVNNYKELAWKSVRHHDGTMYDGMFIVGIDTPDGQATYHYDIDPYWDMFDCKVREFAPEWDGHTPTQAIERIGKLKAQEPRVMTLEEVKALPDESDVWLEEFCSIVVAVTVSHQTDIYKVLKRYNQNATYFYGIERADYNSGEYMDADYGKEWRCWTSRPTYAQREKVKWE